MRPVNETDKMTGPTFNQALLGREPMYRQENFNLQPKRAPLACERPDISFDLRNTIGTCRALTIASIPVM